MEQRIRDIYTDEIKHPIYSAKNITLGGVSVRYFNTGLKTYIFEKNGKYYSIVHYDILHEQRFNTTNNRNIKITNT